MSPDAPATTAGKAPTGRPRPLKSMAELIAALRDVAGGRGARAGHGHRAQHLALTEREARTEIARVAAETGIVDDPWCASGRSDSSTRCARAWRRSPHEPGHRAPRSWTLPFRDPFRIARAEDHRTATHGRRGRRAGRRPAGVGECVPGRLLRGDRGHGGGRPAAAGGGAWRRWARCRRAWRRRGLAGRSHRSSMTDALGNHGAAKAGLDIALHDLAARAMGIPVWQLIGTSDQLPPTDFTLGIDEPAEVAARARAGGPLPGPQDQGRAARRTSRRWRRCARCTAARCAWTPTPAGSRSRPRSSSRSWCAWAWSSSSSPSPPTSWPQLRWLQERSPLPIVADESAVFVERPRRGSWGSWPASTSSS